MPSHIPKNGQEIECLFKNDFGCFGDCESLGDGCNLEFQLAQSSAGLTTTELETCLNLIKETSGDDYNSSSIGWDSKKKLKEMKDQDMIYLVIRQGKAALKRKRSLHGESGDINGKAKKPGTKMRSNSLDREVEELNDYPQPDGADSSIRPQKDAYLSAQDHQPTVDPIHNDDHGRILGFISFKSDYDDPPHEDREVLYINEVHMKDSLRGKGLGSKLICFVEKAAMRCKISKTMLTVFTANNAARRLYERLGYVKDDCSPKDRVVRRRVIEADYVIMSKELAL